MVQKWANYNASSNQVNQSGQGKSGNIGQVQHRGQAGPPPLPGNDQRGPGSARPGLGRRPPGDRRVPEHHRHGQQRGKGDPAPALGNIAGIAKMVEQVGVPVIESVHAVMKAAFQLAADAPRG